MKNTKLGFLGIAALIVALCSSTHSSAAIVLQFNSNSGTFVADNDDTGMTTFSAVDFEVTVGTWLFGGTPFEAFFNFSAESINAATVTDGTVSQRYSGSFSITSLAGGAGINYLSGSFTDAMAAKATGEENGGGLTIFSSNLPSNLSFTSSLIPVNGLEVTRVLSLGLSDLNPALGVSGTPSSISDFETSGLVGTFSAQQIGDVEPIPEPATLAMWGIGALGMSFAGFRRRRAVRK